LRSFRDKLAVVTGAASGTGRALAIELAQRGADLALVDVAEPALAETAAKAATTGRAVSAHVADVADAARMAALPAEVEARHGRVDLLVNNAGVSVTGTLEEQSLEDFRWIVGVNFWGVVHGCKFFLPLLRKAAAERRASEQSERAASRRRAKSTGWAHIVNVSSLFGLIGLPTQSSYCATKFAVRGFSEALWAELRDAGIGVTSVHPGGVRTNIVRASRSADAAAKQRMVERFERIATPPEKVARAILRGVERDRLRILVCPETTATDWVKRLAPAAVHRLVAHGYRRFGSLG
jgi:short-subunit dehydrogenase